MPSATPKAPSRDLRAAERIARDQGATRDVCAALAIGGSIHLARGAFADAIRCHEQVRDLGERIGSTDVRAAARYNLGAVCLALGDEDGALST